MDDYQNPNQINTNNQSYQPASYQPPDNLEPPVQHDDEHHGGTGKKIAITLLCLVLVAATGAVVYLLKQEKSKVSQLNSQVASANSEVSSLKAEQANEPAKSETPAVKQSQDTAYTAKVGKFTLTLPSDKVVVQELDGQTEGGPATHILIGVKTTNPALFDIKYGEFQSTIVANPNYARGGTSFQQWVDEVAAPKNESKKLQSVTVSGVKGDLYSVGGLIGTEKLVFENNKIYYSIEAPNKKQLDEIVKSFKFN